MCLIRSIQAAILGELKRLGVTYESDGSWVDNAELLSSVFALLASLFKIYEFGNHFSKALQILILLENMAQISIATPPDSEFDDFSYYQALCNTIKKVCRLRAVEYFITRRWVNFK